MTPTVVRFPRETLAKIDDIVGEKQRAAFIREAVAAKLALLDSKANEQGDI